MIFTLSSNALLFSLCEKDSKFALNFCSSWSRLAIDCLLSSTMAFSWSIDLSISNINACSWSIEFSNSSNCCLFIVYFRDYKSKRWQTRFYFYLNGFWSAIAIQKLSLSIIINNCIFSVYMDI